MSGSTLNIAEVLPGTQLALVDGSIVQVIDNPRDGTWLVCAAPDDLDAEQLVSAHDIARVI